MIPKGLTNVSKFNLIVKHYQYFFLVIKPSIPLFQHTFKEIYKQETVQPGSPQSLRQFIYNSEFGGSAFGAFRYWMLPALFLLLLLCPLLTSGQVSLRHVSFHSQCHFSSAGNQTHAKYRVWAQGFHFGCR